MLFSRNRTHFLRCVVTKPSPITKRETRLSIPNFDPYFSYLLASWYPPCGRVCVAEEESELFLVGNDRVLHELNLETLNFKESAIAKPSQTSSPQPYCQRGYRVSKNGRQVVGIYIWCSDHCGAVTCEDEEKQRDLGKLNDIRMELRFFDLFGAAGQTKTCNLQYSDLDLSTSTRT